MKRSWLAYGLVLTALASVAACSDDTGDDDTSSSSGSGDVDATTSSSSSSGEATSSSSGEATSSGSSSGEVSSSSSGEVSSSSSGDLVDAGEDATADAAPDAEQDAAVDAADAAPPEPVGDLLHFIGRFDTTNPAVPRFQWSGSGVVASFNGTGISVKLKGDAQMQVVVDGVVKPKVVSTPVLGSYVLADGLPAGVHKVEIYRRDEAEYGSVEFHGLEVQGGALVPTPFPFAHRMEFIGDSITAGYGIEGVEKPELNQYCDATADNTNEYLTYSAVAARALNAAHSSIAWSGRGMVRNYNDNPAPTLPELFDLTIPDEDDLWDFARYTPEVVVVYLGNNDYSKNGPPWYQDPGQIFSDGYVAFLTHLRAKYPAAHLFAVTTNGFPNASQRVQGAVQSRNTAGDARVHFAQLSEYRPDLRGYSCAQHYSIAGHALYGGELATKIRAVMGAGW